MKRGTLMLLPALLLGACLIMTGCESEGPAEKAGKEIDKAYEDAEKSVEKTMDKVKEEIDEAKK